ncbi:MAG: DUF1700 domain-containing protein [Candidatus Fimenecus sp.]
MTKNEFLQELYNHLASLTPAERDDILADFEEHFQAGAERGKSEEQICAELGNPYTCALQYLRTAPGAQPQSAAQPTAQTPPKNTPQPPYGTAAQPVRRINLPWAIVFFIAVFLAIGIYPASALLVLSPIFILIATVFLAAVVPSGTMVGLLISVAVMLCAAGVLGLLVTTWFLKLCYRRADF